MKIKSFVINFLGGKERGKMGSRTYFWPFLLLVCVGFLPAGKAADQDKDDLANVPFKEFFAGGDPNKRYFLIGGGEGIEAPPDGFKLVIVLPGGDGGAGFNPFIKSIYKYSLNPTYLMAQLIAVKWTPQQQVVWPTNIVRVEGQKFSTEEFAEAVVKDVRAKYKLNPKYIFTLAWSTGGPAAYAISLQKEKSVTGSYIAMSDFDPNTLGPLEEAAGHCYFFAHSPDDKVCPIQMTEKANEMLTKAGAKTRFVSYKGGHGWYGDCYARLEWGFGWLEGAVLDQAQNDKRTQAQPNQRWPLALFPACEGFETGDETPAGWRQGAQVEGVEYIWDKKTSFKGTASLCLKKTAKQFSPAAQWFKGFGHDGKPQKLNISAHIKAQQVTKAAIDVQFFGGDRSPLGHQWAACIGAEDGGGTPVDHDWKQYCSIISIPEGTRIIIITLQIYGPGTVWFDELTADYVRLEDQK
jgi:predicted esterase